MRKEKHGKIHELLRSAGLRCTGQRTAILSVLLRTCGPQSADEIAAKLPAPVPNRVTVYRTLETFVDAGIVHKAFLQQRTWHFEVATNCTETQCHPHFTCTQCGTTQCFTDTTLPMARSPRKGFAIDRQRVQLEGLCPKCNVNTA